MIGLNRRKKDTARSILAPTIFLLSIMMIASTIATPAADTTATTMSQPVTVTTDNQSVNVVISWVPMQIEPGQDTEFTLDFQDPSSGEPISHVNYNLEITDQNGETVESMTDLHTHSGSDQQTVTFDNPGSFNLVTTIIGTGIDPPFDTTQSGTAQTVIPVGQQLASASGG
ncbi:MAG: polymerase basic protein 2, partial [Thermoproteota archaeon]|nr:polymerase basic protein 2 [Thermoproteota archaeon]